MEIGTVVVDSGVGFDFPSALEVSFGFALEADFFFDLEVDFDIAFKVGLGADNVTNVLS